MCEKAKNTTSDALPAERRRVRIVILALYAVLVLVWGFGGLLTWSGAFRSLPGWVGKAVALVVALPMGLTTWPAHEFVLEMVTGAGAGANAPITVGFENAAVFVAWAILLWAPLSAACLRKVPVWLALSFQAALLLTVLGLFWEYGNG